MLGRLIDFVVYVVIAVIVGWILTLIVGVLPVIPGNIKDVINLIIWAIVLIAVLLAGVGLFRGTVPGIFNRPGPPVA